MKFYILVKLRYSVHMALIEHKVSSPQLDAYQRYINYGLSHDQSLKAVGTAEPLSTPSIPTPVEQEFKITRNQLNLLLLEAHKKSANSTEEVAAIRELGKINGLYEKEAPDITINITQDIRRLEVMSDADLLTLAGQDTELLTNEPLDYEVVEIEEGEYEEVSDEYEVVEGTQ
mgnify:FL=1|jgi:phenylalanyl-tRNA synthetase beta subunit